MYMFKFMHYHNIQPFSLWSLAGQLLLARGDVEQAFAAFKIVLDGDRDNVPALLGQVLSFMCLFVNKMFIFVLRYDTHL